LIEHWNGRTWQTEDVARLAVVCDALGVQGVSFASCYVTGDVSGALMAPKGEVESTVSTLSDGHRRSDAITGTSRS
jgi:hypothetical protein